MRSAACRRETLPQTHVQEGKSQMKITETINPNPILTEKSVRGEEVRVLTSCKAGKIIPVAFAPMLREDRVSKGSIRVNLEMAETVYPLMNAVNVTAFVHFIPFSAFDRFGGMDEFNRSYQGIPEAHNSTAIPFFQMVNYNRSDEFWNALGVHWPHGTTINGAPLEAYNVLVNHRRETRSRHLPTRGQYDRALAQAFWKNPNLWHIVPDFDQAAMDGEVELQFSNSRAPVRGLGIDNSGGKIAAKSSPMIRQGNGTTAVVTPAAQFSADGAKIWMALKDGVSNGTPVSAPDIFTELKDTGISLSLQNIELAKQTAAFAKLRKQYQGLSEEYLMDLLMEGIRVPDEALRQPILLDRKSTIFGYSERFATDAANLDKSVTTGVTSVDLTFRTPPMNTGGIILVTVEIVPEQLFERMQDNFLATSDPAKLPNFMRDYLDPEKVDVVKNNYVDVLHATPTATFGYAPLNHAWKRSLSHIGGRYKRPETAGFIEDRQRFWSVEKLNPTLTSDFYLVPENLPHTVFKDQTRDPFEILALGNIEIVGNTVFGKTLEENTGEYDKIMAQVDQTRITQA
nr:major capsid protein [Rattus norvegicus microvirus]